MELRDYQIKAKRGIYHAWKEGKRGVFLCLPTGAGKTVTFADIIKDAVAKDKVVALLAHRQELLKQAQKTLLRLAGVQAGIIMGADSTHPESLVQICSVDSMRRRVLPKEPDLIIVDEAHLVMSKRYLTFFGLYPEARRLLVSATPCRLDGTGFESLADELVVGETIEGLVARGYLVPPKIFTGSDVEADLKGIKKQAGDYKLGDLGELMTGTRLMGDVVEQYRTHANGRKGVVFCVNVEHAQQVAEAFKQAGIVAEAIDGSMDTHHREGILHRLHVGITRIVTNCNILCEGWDEPSISYVGLARPTKSLALYIQQAGRGLRLHEGKEDCIIIDHGANVSEHGHILQTRFWSLDGKTYKPKEAKPFKECRACGSWQPKTAESCGHCGYVWPKRNRIIQAVASNIGMVDDVACPVEALYSQCLKKAAKQGKKAGFAYFEAVRAIERLIKSNQLQTESNEEPAITARKVMNEKVPFTRSRELQKEVYIPNLSPNAKLKVEQLMK